MSMRKTVGLAVGLVVDGEHRLLVGEHAADAGAVLVLLVARADALDEGDLLGVRAVGGALTSPMVGPLALSMRSYSSAERTLG